MSRYAFKTRNDSSPIGKPKVYFCSHGDDFKNYFESVSNEILEMVDVAILYKEDPYSAFSKEEMELYFSNVRLFVVPITSNLLSDEYSPAIEEIEFAMKSFIPFLPLMQERGLNEKYSRVFCNLQFLEKFTLDPSAVPYEEKLEKYLRSVISGKDTVNSIRSSFVAYVFLSYRKKDRKYARELMKLIHKSDACQDIAVWYDEYLTPGEDFNETIKRMLADSEVFALVVTPNLVNEENYVKNCEYPMALNKGKEIVPVEFVDTDRGELERQYEDITECIKPGDSVSEIISGRIRREDGGTNSASAEKSFYLGLAYLDGIDVEKDPERALRLITSAAENGSAMAAGKLSDMYLCGNGVQADPRVAVGWLEKKIAIMTADYESAGEELLFCDLLYERLELNRLRLIYGFKETESIYNIIEDGERVLEHSCHPVAAETLISLYHRVCANEKYALRALERVENLQKSVQGDAVSILSAVCHIRCASVIGDRDKALEHIKLAISMLEEIRNRGEEPVFNELSEAYETLGNLEASTQKALIAYEKAIYYKKCGGEAEECAYVCAAIAETLFDSERYAEAKEACLHGIGLLEPLMENDGEERMRRVVADIYKRCIRICDKLNDTAGAFAFATKAAEVRIKLAEKYPFGHCIDDAVTALEEISDFFRDRNDLQSAICFSEKLISLLSELCNAKRYGGHLQATVISTAELYLELGDIEGAERCISDWERVSKEKKLSQHDISMLDLRARILDSRGEYEKAAENYLRAYILRFKDFGEGYWNELVTFAERMAEAFARIDRAQVGKELLWISKAVEDGRLSFTEGFEPAAEVFSACAALNEIRGLARKRRYDLCFAAAANIVVGAIHELRGEFEIAFEYYLKCVIRYIGKNVKYEAVAKKIVLLGTIAVNLELYDRALICFEMAENRLEIVYAEQKNAPKSAFDALFKHNCFRSLCRCLQSKGDLVRKSNVRAALCAYERAAEIYSENDENPYELYELLISLAGCYYEDGNFMRASDCYNRAEEVRGYRSERFEDCYRSCISHYFIGETDRGGELYRKSREIILNELDNTEFMGEIFDEENCALWLSKWAELCLAATDEECAEDSEIIASRGRELIRHCMKAEKKEIVCRALSDLHVLYEQIMERFPSKECYLTLLLGYSALVDELRHDANEQDLQNMLLKFIAFLEKYGSGEFDPTENKKFLKGILDQCNQMLLRTKSDDIDKDI